MADSYNSISYFYQGRVPNTNGISQRYQRGNSYCVNLNDIKKGWTLFYNLIEKETLRAEQ